MPSELFNSDSRILTAVSGGVDSMVMLHQLHCAGIHVAAAHCNFGLRGDESDADEHFVTSEAEKLGIPCFSKRFDTLSHAAQHGLSTQMAARELRYRWFHDLAESEGFDVIATAHHRDDRIETLFINLARGTGIHGLTGIRPRSGKIVRPLLFASRMEIEAYAEENGIAFREDSSNATDKYARNHIRHHVIPGMEKFFPGMRQSMERGMENFSAVELFYNEAIERYKSQIVTQKDDLALIDFQGLSLSPSPPALLYEILKPYGFANAVAAEILENHSSGRQFFSETHRLVCDRKHLTLQKTESEGQREYLIEEHATGIDAPIRLKIEIFDRHDGYAPPANPNIACLDADKLQFPLLLRKWKSGDKFQPLGMKNMKKLSDFFTNDKLSLIEKERCWILVSGGQIAWIAGRRIDERFKIDAGTKRVWKCGM